MNDEHQEPKDVEPPKPQGIWGEGLSGLRDYIAEQERLHEHAPSS